VELGPAVVVGVSGGAFAGGIAGIIGGGFIGGDVGDRTEEALLDWLFSKPVVPPAAQGSHGSADAEEECNSEKKPAPRVNKVGPDPSAQGPHSVAKRGPSGKVTGYTEFDAAGNPVKRFRGEGGPHGGMDPPFILEPKPGKGPGSTPKVPRLPRPDELPPGY
jgi:hypothetical protein